MGIMNDIRKIMKENDDDNNKSNINLHETQKTNQWMRFWCQKLEWEMNKKKIKMEEKKV